MSGEETGISSQASPSEPMASPQEVSALGEALGGALKFYGGLDLGVYESVVTAAEASNPLIVELECNDLSGRATPSILAFSKRHRLVGDTAENVMVKEHLSTFPLLPLLVSCTSKSSYIDLKSRFGPLISYLEAVQDDSHIQVTFGGKQWQLEPSQILAAFLRRLASFAADGRSAKSGSSLSLSAGQFCLALPQTLFLGNALETTQLAAARACRTGALRAELTKIVPQMTAVAAAWLARNLAAVLDQHQASKFSVAIFNLGFSETAIQILNIERSKEEEEEQNLMADNTKPAETTEEKGDTSGAREDKSVKPGPAEPVMTDANEITINGARVRLGVCETLPFGAFDLARKLATLYAEVLEKKGVRVPFDKAFQVEGSSLNRSERKAVSAVLSSSMKLMKDLSGLTSAHSTYSDEEVDIQVEVSREQFEIACESQISAVAHLVVQALQTIEFPLLGVELVGGGSRIPAVQKAIEGAVQEGNLELLDRSLPMIRRTLDGSAAAAIGACYLASGQVPLPVVEVSSISHVWTSDAQRESEMSAEKAMRNIEEEEVRRMSASNRLEATLMRMENLSRDTNVANREQLSKLTQEISDWFYDHIDADLSAEEYDKVEATLSTKAQAICHEYFEQEKVKKEQLEQELERRAKEAEGKEKEDHDFRKLPNSQRLEKAERNKNEGNDMFKAGNHLKAVERYQQALGHLDKMINESPAELEKKKQLRISLNLNIAIVYSKFDEVEALNKVISRCDMALSYDENNSKVLYRRGLAYERKRRFEEALDDIQKCAQLQLETEGAVDAVTSKAIARLNEALKQQKEKEKQMYAKMF